ncbi:uncharacterized protein [Oscarella lobularis]|uniref:uncharacterized protein isoform X2 n=1 Tax=Oscarella lobularis TaxID=121494 RepID=UPI003313B10F
MGDRVPVFRDEKGDPSTRTSPITFASFFCSDLRLRSAFQLIFHAQIRRNRANIGTGHGTVVTGGLASRWIRRAFCSLVSRPRPSPASFVFFFRIIFSFFNRGRRSFLMGVDMLSHTVVLLLVVVVSLRWVHAIGPLVESGRTIRSILPCPCKKLTVQGACGACSSPCVLQGGKCVRKCTDGYLLDSLSSSCSPVFSLTALNETLALTTSDALLFGNGTIDVKATGNVFAGDGPTSDNDATVFVTSSKMNGYIDLKPSLLLQKLNWFADMWIRPSVVKKSRIDPAPTQVLFHLTTDLGEVGFALDYKYDMLFSSVLQVSLKFRCIGNKLCKDLDSTPIKINFAVTDWMRLQLLFDENSQHLRASFSDGKGNRWFSGALDFRSAGYTVHNLRRIGTNATLLTSIASVAGLRIYPSRSRIDGGILNNLTGCYAYSSTVACSSCWGSYYMFSGSCVTKCPRNWYSSSSGNLCLRAATASPTPDTISGAATKGSLSTTASFTLTVTASSTIAPFTPSALSTAPSAAASSTTAFGSSDTDDATSFATELTNCSPRPAESSRDCDSTIIIVGAGAGAGGFILGIVVTLIPAIICIRQRKKTHSQNLDHPSKTEEYLSSNPMYKASSVSSSPNAYEYEYANPPPNKDRKVVVATAKSEDSTMENRYDRLSRIDERPPAPLPPDASYDKLGGLSMKNPLFNAQTQSS